MSMLEARLRLLQLYTLKDTTRQERVRSRATNYACLFVPLSVIPNKNDAKSLKQHLILFGSTR